MLYSIMPVPMLRDVKPAGWVNCFRICMSTMPGAQNVTAKGSILKEDDLGIIFIYELEYT